jgi:hypothetical protein
MEIVTIRQVPPIGIWVNNYPVIFPFLDSVLAPSPDAFDLVEEWATDLYYLKFTRDESYMVYLPERTRENVMWAAKRLSL